LKLGQSRVIAEGTDITILSSGICTEEVMRIRPALDQRGVSLRHLHVSTLKPFGDPSVLAAIEATGLGVITAENHTIIGGLGSAVAELMAETGIARRLVRLGLRDEYAHGASRPYLMKKYGLDAAGLVKAVERLTGEPLGISEGELTRCSAPPVKVTDTADAAKAEDL
jgi:transketolase